MSALDEKLFENQKAAMRAGDQVRLSAIRMVRNGLQNARIDKGSDLTEAEALEVIGREARQRRETIAEATKASRKDVVEREEAYLAVVSEYLPQQLSKEQVEAEARKAIAEVGARGLTDRGRVMGKLMPALRGKADGKLVASVVEELLGR